MHSLRYRDALLIAIVAAMVTGCANQADLEEIKKNQREILVRLNAIETRLQPRAVNRPAAPQADYTTIRAINLDGVSLKGAANARVTLVEFTDYQ